MGARIGVSSLYEEIGVLASILATQKGAKVHPLQAIQQSQDNAWWDPLVRPAVGIRKNGQTMITGPWNVPSRRDFPRRNYFDGICKIGSSSPSFYCIHPQTDTSSRKENYRQWYGIGQITAGYSNWQSLQESLSLSDRTSIPTLIVFPCLSV